MSIILAAAAIAAIGIIVMWPRSASATATPKTARR